MILFIYITTLIYHFHQQKTYSLIKIGFKLLATLNNWTALLIYFHNLLILKLNF